MSTLTLTRYYTSDGKYPGRETSDELDLVARVNAGKLIEAVNGLLTDLGIKNVTITSGFRTVAANVAAGGSKNSAHCLCLAIDLADPDHDIYRTCRVNVPLLEKWGIYLEHEDATPTWTHMTIRRPGSGARFFHP